jgi:hypothetical protein
VNYTQAIFDAANEIPTGGSTILLLFEPGKMAWDDDLVDNSNGALETLVSASPAVLMPVY